MGYLFLSFSLLAGATKGFCGKKMGNYAKETVTAVRMNLLRMGFCILFGVLMMLMMGEIGAFTLSPRAYDAHDGRDRGFYSFSPCLIALTSFGRQHSPLCGDVAACGAQERVYDVRHLSDAWHRIADDHGHLSVRRACASSLMAGLWCSCRGGSPDVLL